MLVSSNPYKLGEVQLVELKVALEALSLTPTDEIVELERRRRVEYFCHDPGVQVHALDEHPEDGRGVAVHQQHQDHFAEMFLEGVEISIECTSACVCGETPTNSSSGTRVLDTNTQTCAREDIFALTEWQCSHTTRISFRTHTWTDMRGQTEVPQGRSANPQILRHTGRCKVSLKPLQWVLFAGLGTTISEYFISNVSLWVLHSAC